MKVLITGSRGLVGSNIVEAAPKYNLNLLTPSRKELDLTDYQATLKYIEESSPDVIIHAAGVVGGIQANIDEPFKFTNDNLLMGINLINAALKCNVRDLINLGSSCMYPKEAENPLSENVLFSGALEPTNEGYAIAKLTVAKLCQFASKECDVNYKTLIPCNLYGKYDKFDSVKSHMIPAVIMKTHRCKVEGLNNIDIWGDGTARREFMFAGDLAEFILSNLNKVESLPDMMNIGVGKDYSIEEFYKIISEVIGFTGKFSFDLSKPAGMKQKLVDVKKQNELGWTPKVGLKEGIIETYNYYLNGEKNASTSN